MNNRLQLTLSVSNVLQFFPPVPKLVFSHVLISPILNSALVSYSQKGSKS